MHVVDIAVLMPLQFRKAIGMLQRAMPCFVSRIGVLAGLFSGVLILNGSNQMLEKVYMYQYVLLVYIYS